VDRLVVNSSREFVGLPVVVGLGVGDMIIVRASGRLSLEASTRYRRLWAISNTTLVTSLSIRVLQWIEDRYDRR